MKFKPKHNLWIFTPTQNTTPKTNHSFLEVYPIIQQRDITLKTNKTLPFTTANYDANYAELIKTIKFSLPAMIDFTPKSPVIYY